MQDETNIRQHRTPQACDACKRRKVRCNGAARCQQCEHLDLRCTYTPGKRGRPRKNAAGRGTIIAQYRKLTNDNSNSNSNHSWSGQIRLSPAQSLDSVSRESAAFDPILPPISSSNHPDPEYFLQLIPDYLAYVYPVNPVITQAEIQNCIEQMGTSSEAASFTYAFAAVTINLTKMVFSSNAPDLREQTSHLITRALEHRESLSIENATQPWLFRIMTSIFLQICFMNLRQINLGFYYLRDAISLVQLLRINSSEHTCHLSVPERSRLQRLYWECYIHERFTALSHYLPPILLPLPSGLPEHDPTLLHTVESGWSLIIETFLPVDTDFIQYWLGDRSQVTPAWLESKHGQLQLSDAAWHDALASLSDMQQADLIITRQWLRTLIWQVALSSPVLLSSEALTMPLQLSSQLRLFLQRLGPNSVGIHGLNILYKLFEITNAIADVVIHLPDASRDETLARVDDILFLKDFIFGFHRIEAQQKRILMDKFERMRERFPEMEEIRELIGLSMSVDVTEQPDGEVVWGE